MRLRLSHSLVLALLALPGAARAQQIKSRVMVLLDTSGSMGYHFRDPTVFGTPKQGGDYPGGDGSTSLTDSSVTNQFSYPGKAVGGVCSLTSLQNCDGRNSRLYAAKSVLSNAINAYAGDVDFGLMTYDFQLCAFNQPQCEPCIVQCMGMSCGYTCLYTDNSFMNLVNINWRSQGCGGPGRGGRILVTPGTGSGPKILPWIDGIEDHRDSGDGVTSFGTTGTPRNPEIRAEGNTPLAEAMAAARTQWYDVVKASDPLIDCRPYVLVVETDGAQSTGSGCGADPVAAAQAMFNDNPRNPVKVYMLAVSLQAQDLAVMNNAAQAGGTGQARVANSQIEIQAAYADILAQSVKYEQCNGADDTCNGFIDEGLGVYQDCTANTQCTVGQTCNSGRCTCGNSTHCAAGYACAGGFCKPACSIGVGACLRNGVKKCSGTSTACCVNDGLAACAPLMAGAPGALVCNGQDNNCNGQIDDFETGCMMGQGCRPTAEVCNGRDDDCDSVIDNNLIDIGKTCGLNIGQCQPGTTQCVNSAGRDVTQAGVTPDAGDHLMCASAIAPAAAACNGCDNDCDGLVDRPTQNCYSGVAATKDVGICHGGRQVCTASVCNPVGGPTYGACVGEVLPQMEICNGVDDDCNGAVDNVPGAGTPCCPSGRCGMGICTDGSLQCSGGMLSCVGGQGPEGEVCNGLDDDCNGMTDDLPTLGRQCTPTGACTGMLVCDVAAMQVVCQPTGGVSLPELCNGMDDDCDGVVDEPVDVAMNDPRIGKPCGNDNGRPLPCVAGKTVCRNGGVECEGAVGPTPEACNCKDDDCDTTIDNNAPCPTGTSCYAGVTGDRCGCYARCLPGEFKCPGGYECDANDYCVPILSCDPPCAFGFECRQGVCKDRCENHPCPATYKCVNGNCVGDSCVEEPARCATCVNGQGERCDIVNRACVDDLCCGVTCAGNEFCDINTGLCVKTCEGVTCDAGQTCVNGVCVTQMCTGRTCQERELCDPTTGMCVMNKCADVNCMAPLICVAGNCVQDTCDMVRCDPGFKCTTNPLDGSHSCDSMVVAPKDQDQVVSAGSGGFACSVDPRSRGNRSEGVALLAAALALILVRRRR